MGSLDSPDKVVQPDQLDLQGLKERLDQTGLVVVLVHRDLLANQVLWDR